MNFYNHLLPAQDVCKSRYENILVGIVKENWDESNKGKIKVEIFFGEEGRSETSWIRVASPYTAGGAGMYLLPEIETEVLVAFIGGNKNTPIVIGSLWNGKNEVSDDFAAENNTIKAFRTKAGHEVLFAEEEEKGKITVQTVGKIVVSLSDEDKSVTITDENEGCMIKLDFENEKITLDSAKELHLAIGGTDAITIDSSSISIKSDSITLEGGQSLTMKGQSTEITGNSLNIKSDAALEVKAGATLKLEGSAMSELKGGMVKIN